MIKYTAVAHIRVGLHCVHVTHVTDVWGIFLTIPIQMVLLMVDRGGWVQIITRQWSLIKPCCHSFVTRLINQSELPKVAKRQCVCVSIFKPFSVTCKPLC